jgi:hypothetical protein
MKLKIDVEVEVVDKDGQQVYHDKREANSFVRGMIDVLYELMMAAYPANNILDITNTTRTGSLNGSNLAVAAAAGNTNLGIVLGTGTNAVTVADYKLQTLIGEGATSGLLNYQAMATDSAPATAGNVRSFTIKRQVINNSGADITVNEVGLYGYCVGQSNYYGMFDRTLNTFTILSLATAVVKYTISVTV